MDPALLAALSQQHADVEAIVNIVGWPNIWKIVPHAEAILAAYQKNAAAAPHGAAST